MAIRSAKQKAKNYFNGNSNGARNTERRYSRESAPSYRPKRKIIDPNIGEYVEFEELRTYTSDTTCNTSDTTIKYKEEEQIEDAVWEEIKK